MDALDPTARRDLFVVDETTPQAARPRTPLEARAKLLLTLAMWGSSYLIFTMGILLARQPVALVQTGARALSMLLGIGLCYGLHLLLTRVAHRRFRTRVIIAAAAAPFIAEFYAWIDYFVFVAAEGRPALFAVDDWYEAISVLSLWTWFFIAWTGLYLAIEYSFEARYEAERSAGLRSMAHVAKLRALSNQINPHFLFNSLNSISALILDGKSADAEKMLGRLSSFFRSTLAIDPLIDVSVDREFELHRRYLAIERMRYPDLTVQFTLPDDLRSAMIPALILQPLVENAVKHGVARSASPARIEMAAAQDGAMLVLSVTNSGLTAKDQTAPCGGIGIANVRERLAEYFGSAQSLVLYAAPDRFEARVKLPLRYRP